VESLLVGGQDLEVGVRNAQVDFRRILVGGMMTGWNEDTIEVPEEMGAMTRSDTDDRCNGKFDFLAQSDQEFRVVYLACTTRSKVDSVLHWALDNSAPVNRHGESKIRCSDNLELLSVTSK
jgi:hypothetical protein